MKFNRKRIEIFAEFLIFGVAMGLAEDLIALKLATGEPITLKIVGIVTLVAIPFAVVGELVVDRMKIVANHNNHDDEKIEDDKKMERAHLKVTITKKEAVGAKKI
ncbi:MAG: hypothetical protein OEY44_01430 [Candidatus Peregrinibacteria bacterium]|nr:hypothetical protein [Candidatus Peregrinibacteria bacterium]